jgi:hypothetical protein
LDRFAIRKAKQGPQMHDANALEQPQAAQQDGNETQE